MRLAFEDAQERGGATSLHASHVSALRIVTTIICAGSKESADALEAVNTFLRHAISTRCFHVLRS